MTYRPRSSVTTTLLNRVGRSEVSAMTHTPASGPFAPETTPPMSFAPTRTCGLGSTGTGTKHKRHKREPKRHKKVAPAFNFLCFWGSLLCLLCFVPSLLRAEHIVCPGCQSSMAQGRHFRIIIQHLLLKYAHDKINIRHSMFRCCVVCTGKAAGL